MSKRIIAYILFAVGVLLLEMHTTLAMIWQIIGFSGAYPLSRSIVMYYAQGFTPILGGRAVVPRRVDL
jgi:hypothetical protein